MTLDEILRTIEREGDGFRLAAPAGWHQGRALYGGLGAALCLAGAKLMEPVLPPLRAAQIAFLAPASGTLRLTPTMLRQGRSASVVAIDLAGEAGVATRALLTFGGVRENAVRYDRLVAPGVPAPDACSPTPAHLIPGFLANFEMRPAGGALPLSGAEEHEILAWARFRADAGSDPEIALLAIADVLPPAATIGMSRAAPFSTMAWHFDVLQSALPSAWYLVCSRSEEADQGYARQTMACWNEDGRCLATGRQTIALFGGGD